MVLEFGEFLEFSGRTTQAEEPLNTIALNAIFFLDSGYLSSKYIHANSRICFTRAQIFLYKYDFFSVCRWQ